jgi:hypothetical protein
MLAEGEPLFFGFLIVFVIFLVLGILYNMGCFGFI